MKVFLDTNIWLRYLDSDEASMYASCNALMHAIAEGKIKAYTSAIVFLELSFVLRRIYKVPKEKMNDDILRLLALRGLVLIEQTDFRRAFAWHRTYGVKLADCLIATQVKKGMTLVTYDEEFKKLPLPAVATPADVMLETS